MKHLLKFIIFIFMGFEAFASSNISIGDTTIPRGSIYSIPINCNFDAVKSTSLEFVFEYDQFVLDIKGIDLPETSILNGEKYSFTQDLSVSPAICRVKFDSTDLSINSGVLFDLKIEGLVAPRDSSVLKCTEVKINGKDTVYTSQNAIIKVPGDLVLQDYPTGLYPNFPNPFRGSTTFQFNLDSESSVKFELFNYFGTRLYDYSDLCKHINIISISKETGEKEITDFNSVLPKGKYYFRFTADESFFPSGAYILTLKTNNRFLSQPFLYVK